MCARKMYNVKGGDARQVLDLCMFAIREKLNELSNENVPVENYKIDLK